MRAGIWWQAFTAAVSAVRRRTPEQDEAVQAEQSRGVVRLGEHVAARDGEPTNPQETPPPLGG